jgi:hypothetical protein
MEWPSLEKGAAESRMEVTMAVQDTGVNLFPSSAILLRLKVSDAY